MFNNTEILLLNAFIMISPEFVAADARHDSTNTSETRRKRSSAFFFRSPAMDAEGIGQVDEFNQFPWPFGILLSTVQ